MEVFDSMETTQTFVEWLCGVETQRGERACSQKVNYDNYENMFMFAILFVENISFVYSRVDEYLHGLVVFKCESHPKKNINQTLK